MQIIPTQTGIFGLMAQDFIPAFNSLAGRGSDSFADILQMNASSAQQTPSFVAAPVVQDYADQSQSSRGPATVSARKAQMAEPDMPSSQADDSLRNVKMTKEDYAGVRDKLEQAGVPKDKLDELEQKVQSPEGLTWGQFMHTMHQTVMQQYMKPQTLDAADKASISSLLSRIGFDAKQADQLTDALSNGKTASRAFDLIAAKLASQDSSQTISLSKSDMAALTKALKLPDATAQKLLGQFGANQNVELSPQAMRDTFLNVAAQVTQTLSQAKDAMRSVKDLISPAMDKARQRLGAEQQAKQSQVDSSQVKASSLLKDPQELAAAAKDAKNAKSDSIATDDKHHHPHHDSKDAAGTVQKNDKSGHQPGGNSDPRDAKPDDKQAAKDPKATPDRAWSDFTSKIKVDGEPQLSPDSRFATAQTLASQLTQQNTASASGQTPRLQAPQILDQVQSGILKNLGQGMKQLTLELTPESLGKLSVVLTVKGKEVQAVIKAENPQAEQVLAENLHKIKQTLEDQGLTVSKMEVRTGLQQDANLTQQQQQWGGADKHNLTQERREALERMRTTSLLSGGTDIADLAQRMQNGSVTVKNSQGGLNLIA